MELIFKFLSVFGLAALELWAAVPLGLAMKLSPMLTGIATASGAIVGVIIVIVLGNRVRSWMLAKKKLENGEKKDRLIIRIWEKYGVVGLGLLGPFMAGAPLSAAIGVMFGAPFNRLLFWLTVGILFWTAGLTAVGMLGMETFTALWNKYF